MAKKKTARTRPPAAGAKRPAPRAPANVQSGGARRQRTALYIALGVVAFLVVAAVVFGRGSGGSSGHKTGTTAAASGPECVTDTQMDHYSSKDNGRIVHTDSPGYTGPLQPHDDPVYTVNPPSGGDHLSLAAPPRAYEGAGVPPDGNLVHSLEHGYVIIWFKPSLSASDRAKLGAERQQYARDTLLVERSNMDRPVAATAWGHRMLCNGVNTGALSAFIVDNRNQGPEKIPH
jgi:hypothetical protein